MIDLPMSKLEHDSLATTLVGILSDDGSLEYFRGIPYAKVSQRWEQANEIESFEDLASLDCTKNGAKCPQEEFGNNSLTFGVDIPFPSDVTNDEFNCLNLFVIRPANTPKDAKLPCFVWIHGGGFAFGAASDPMWDPSNLVRKSIENGTPIVTVTINYRLSLFGMISSSDLLKCNSRKKSIYRGNYLLGDQHIALKWLNKHLPGFGGDVNNITVAGQSAGGCATSCQILGNSPNLSEKPLFKRAIMHSGAAGTITVDPIEKKDEEWFSLCRQFGIDVDNTTPEERVAKMRDVSADDLLTGARALGIFIQAILLDDVFLTDKTYSIRERHVIFSEDFRTYCEEVMGGFVRDDGYGVLVNPSKPLTKAKLASMKASYSGDFEALDKLISTYNMDSADPMQATIGLCNFATDYVFGRPSKAALDNLPSYTKRYLFFGTKGNPFNRARYESAHHCVDLIYMFDAFKEFIDELEDKDEKIFASNWGDIWLDFITGIHRLSVATDKQKCTFSWSQLSGTSTKSFILFNKDLKISVAGENDCEDYSKFLVRSKAIPADAATIYESLLEALNTSDP
ncbi:Alpha/Beta hydrolase protein [Dipodascopsis uninucleata]